jgi:uncharacterized membrane protein
LEKIKNVPFIFWGLLLLLVFNGIYWIALTSAKTVLLMGFALPIILALIEVLFSTKITTRIKNANYWCFGIVISVIALVYMLVFPPFTQPDSQYHYESAYRYSNFLLGLGINSDLIMRHDDVVLFTDIESNALSQGLYAACKANFSFFVNNATLETTDATHAVNISSNLPQVRLVGALGITIGRLLHLGAFPTYYLGIIFNIAVFAILVSLSIKITPIGKPCFAALALLPMTLHLASSYSYDTTIIALSFLLTAMLLRAMYSKEQFSTKEFWLIVIVAILLAPCKVVYTVILCLIFFIPKKRFSNRRNEIIAKSLPLILCFIEILIIQASSLATMATSNTADNLDHRGAETGSFYSLSDFIRHPKQILALYFNSFVVRANLWFTTLMGGSLGWLQESIAANFVTLLPFVICLIFTLIPTNKEKANYKLPRYIRACFFAIGIFVVFLVTTSMVLAWTFNTEHIIEGVQGRYFIPVMPLLMLACRPKEITSTKKVQGLAVNALVFLNTMYITAIYGKALLLV